MFEVFTEQARAAILLAQEEARALGHPCIGTSHLLLGLLRRQPPKGQQARPEHHAFLACKSIGVDYEQLRETLVLRLGDRGPGPSGHISFSRTTNAALRAAALSVALELKTGHVSTGHMLLGLTYDTAADPPALKPGFLRRKAHLQNPAFYDIGQRALIDAAGSLDLVRQAVLRIDASSLGTQDTTPYKPTFAQPPTPARAAPTPPAVQPQASYNAVNHYQPVSSSVSDASPTEKPPRSADEQGG